MRFNFEVLKKNAKKYRFGIIGVLFVCALLIFMNLPQDMGGVANVSAAFGTPVDKDQKINSVAIGYDITDYDKIGIWTSSTASNVYEIDAEKEIDVAEVAIQFDDDEIYDSDDWQNCVKVYITVEKNNVTVYEGYMNLYMSIPQTIVTPHLASYRISGMGIEVNDGDWFDIIVKYYVKLSV